jgi:hypothetical protein
MENFYGDRDGDRKFGPGSECEKLKNGKTVPDWEISVSDWPPGGLYTHPSLKNPYLAPH